MTPCTTPTCPRRALANNAMCLKCWNAWFETKREGTRR